MSEATSPKKLMHSVTYVDRENRLVHYLCGLNPAPLYYTDTGNIRLRDVSTAAITCPACKSMAFREVEMRDHWGRYHISAETALDLADHLAPVNRDNEPNQER